MPDEKFSSIPAITQIISLCLDIQNAGLATTFFSVSGHVTALDVRFYIGGWRKETGADRDIYLWMDETRYDASRVSGIITSLNQVLINRRFPETF